MVKGKGEKVLGFSMPSPIPAILVLTGTSEESTSVLREVWRLGWRGRWVAGIGVGKGSWLSGFV